MTGYLSTMLVNCDRKSLQLAVLPVLPKYDNRFFHFELILITDEITMDSQINFETYLNILTEAVRCQNNNI